MSRANAVPKAPLGFGIILLSRSDRGDKTPAFDLCRSDTSGPRLNTRTAHDRRNLPESLKCRRQMRDIMLYIEFVCFLSQRVRLGVRMSHCPLPCTLCDRTLRLLSSYRTLFPSIICIASQGGPGWCSQSPRHLVSTWWNNPRTMSNPPTQEANLSSLKQRNNDYYY